MNNTEFSDQFDTLLDSYKIANNFGEAENLYTLKVDEYEKSLFLTYAQYDFINDLYSGRNISGKSYEEIEELRRYLADLNKSEDIKEFYSFNGLSKNSIKCKLNSDVLYITHEQCIITSEDKCLDGEYLDTYPIKRDQYNRVRKNPFRNNKIWRIDLSDNEIELISKHIINTYKVSYIRKPKPIILEDLDDISIEGISEKTECELNPNLHRFILERAVMKAVQHMAIQNNKEEE